MVVRVTNNTPAVKAILKRNIKDALNAVGIFVSGQANANAPVDTGQLHNSYTYRIFNNGRVSIGSPLDYSKYVELGTGVYAIGGRTTGWVYRDRHGNFQYTVGQRPQPHLLPAAENNISIIRNIVVENLKKGL